jgi:predicted nucleotidyltransferase
MTISCVLAWGMKSLFLDIDHERLDEICQRYKILRLALFGSVIREDFREDSDVDVLVEFEPDARVGLSFFSLQDELSDLLGRTVDLNTPGFLSPRFRDDVIHESRLVYEAA